MHKNLLLRTLLRQERIDKNSDKNPFYCNHSQKKFKIKFKFLAFWDLARLNFQLVKI